MTDSPETRADLVLRLLAEEVQLRDDAATGRVVSSSSELVRSAKLYREAADTITALVDDMDGMIDQHIVMRKDWRIAELEHKLAALQLVVDQAEHAMLPLPGCDYLATNTADTPLPCNCFKASASTEHLVLHDAEVWDEGVRAKSASSSIFDADVFAQNPYRIGL